MWKVTHIGRSTIQEWVEDDDWEQYNKLLQSLRDYNLDPTKCLLSFEEYKKTKERVLSPRGERCVYCGWVKGYGHMDECLTNRDSIRWPEQFRFEEFYER